ncbi:MAG TPA: FliH/SctL family protein [Ignavibacteriales bacterium]|nr:FliH/SctL family protein [Ignavibacteriales bacterium]
MSDVVKLNLRTGAVKIKFNSEFDTVPEDKAENEAAPAKEEDYIQLQLQNYYDKGFQEAQRLTATELEKEYTQRLIEKTEEFNRILAAIETNLSEYEQSFDSIVTEVAVIIAEKIVRHEISKESVISSTLRESVKKILGANEVIIKINPKDFASLHSDQEGVLLEESFSKIKFEQDDKIETGGCIVETDIGSVDSRIATQISEIKKHLDNHFNNQVT